MKVRYKKDLRHNYMMISDVENIETQSFSTRLLEHQRIRGILPVEQRKLDNESRFYYDITAKQSMAAIYDKALLTKEKIKQLCIGIIDIIESAYEYLLPEDDFILEPEYIYMDLVTDEPALCFIPGYDKNIKSQMSSLMEYLMNKVDYSDREAVLLVYQLYALSREEGYTFNHLREELLVSTQSMSDSKQSYKDKSINSNKSINTTDQLLLQQRTNIRNDSNLEFNSFHENHTPQAKEEIISSKNVMKDFFSASNQMAVMKEKLEREEEVSCYPITTYLYTVASIIGGLIILIASLITKILYNSYGDQIDYTKLAALLLIVFCVEGYCVKTFWNKKNRITKIVTKNEYVDPRQIINSSNKSKLFYSKQEETSHSDLSEKKGTFKGNQEEQNMNAQQGSYSNDKIYYQDNVRQSIEIARDKGNLDQDHTTSKYQNHTVGEYQDHTMQEYYTSLKNDTNTKNTYRMNETTFQRNNTNLLQEQNYNEPDNPTCLLNSPGEQNICSIIKDQSFSCILKALDEDNYQPICIKEFPFFIGKLKKNVDYCLEKDVVSRYHAKITKEDNNYVITDLNSTNGTFVNGLALQTYEKRNIIAGDEIAIANIKYRFEINN